MNVRLAMVLLGLGLTAGAATGPRAHPTSPPAGGSELVAPDLLLTPADTRFCQSLSHFGWGMFLQLQYEASRAKAQGGRRFLPTPFLPLPAADGKPAGKGAPGKPRPPLVTSATLPPYLYHYREAIRLAPENEAALELFVASVLLAYNADTLIVLLEDLSLELPAASQIAVGLSQLLAADKRYAEAITVLQSCLLAADWESPEVVRQLVAVLWETQQYDAAEDVLDQALRQGTLANSLVVNLVAAQFHVQRAHLPENAKATGTRKQLLRQALRQARRAADRFADLYDKTPDDGLFPVTFEDTETLYALLFDLEDFTGSLAVLELATEVFSDEQPTLDFMSARNLIRLGKDKEAGALLDTVASVLKAVRTGAPAAGKSPAGRADEDGPMDSLRGRRRLFQDFVTLGQLNLLLERPEAAAAAYEQALLVLPAETRLRLLLGHLYLGLKKSDLALKSVAGIGGEPQAPQLLLLSRIYMEQKKFEDAARALALAEAAAAKGKDKNFFDRDYYFFAAMLCEAMGYIDRSLEKARQAHALNPQDPVSANFLGYLLADHNRSLEEAEKLILQAVAAEPKNDAYLDSLAWVYYRQQRFAAAAKAMGQALKYAAGKPDPVILDHAGDIALALGRLAEARRHWEQALKEGAEKPELIRQKLAQNPALERE